jgi:hypothetical protein
MIYLAALLICISLVFMSYTSCKEERVTCYGDVFPMVSTILRLPEYAKAVPVVGTFFACSSLQILYRALFYKLGGIIGVRENDVLLIIGLLGCLFIPLIGLFDSKNFPHTHSFVAVTYFVLQYFYFLLIAVFIYLAERSKRFTYPNYSSYLEVRRLYHMSWFLTVAFTGTILTMILLNTRHLVTAVFEWTYLLIVTNYFCFLAGFVEEAEQRVK